MTTRESPTDFEVAVNPIKERACEAFTTVLKGRQRRPSAALRVMRKGDERC